MISSQPQKIRLDVDLNHDYITNLPVELKEKILLKLPLKEAVRTSILSSKWIDSWASIPSLVFEENFTKDELVKLVDIVLLVHQGPTRKFKLVSEHDCNEAIGQWMLILSRTGIRELELKFNNDERCKLPSRLFACHTLEDVNLSGCIFSGPQVLQSFKLMHTLHLSHFDLSGMSIGNLVSSCPLLQSLTLSYFLQEGCLCILAQNLTYLNIFGEFHDICLDTPKLTSGCINLDTFNGDFEELSTANQRNQSNVTFSLGHLSNIQKLDICGEFTCYLSLGPIPQNYPTIFNCLTELHVYVCVPAPSEIATALFLFHNAPMLEVLHLEFWDSDGCTPIIDDSWDLISLQYCLFKRLKIVNIMYDQIIELSIRSAKSMLEFAAVVLCIAPVLQKLNVIDLEEVMVYFKMLECFPKLSKKAKIVSVKTSDE